MLMSPPSLLMSPPSAANDNLPIPSRPRLRESFVLQDLVATRRRLRLKDCALGPGAVGRILNVRAPGRLYDVAFPAAGAMVMTLSHCDIARCAGY